MANLSNYFFLYSLSILIHPSLLANITNQNLNYTLSLFHLNNLLTFNVIYHDIIYSNNISISHSSINTYILLLLTKMQMYSSNIIHYMQTQNTPNMSSTYLEELEQNQIMASQIFKIYIFDINN